VSDTDARVLQGISAPLLSIKTTGSVREPSLKRIIAPLDGSEKGKAALPHAAALAKNLQAELILLQVVPRRKGDTCSVYWGEAGLPSRPRS